MVNDFSFKITGAKFLDSVKYILLLRIIPTLSYTFFKALPPHDTYPFYSQVMRKFSRSLNR